VDIFHPYFLNSEEWEKQSVLSPCSSARTTWTVVCFNDFLTTSLSRRERTKVNRW
jgi:hypothetical protein